MGNTSFSPAGRVSTPRYGRRVHEPGARPPSVDALARSMRDLGLPHPLLVTAARQAIADGSPDRARDLAEDLGRTLLRPVVNATGVLLHTNLGRAPLAVEREATYTNLELDLRTGARGSRSGHAARLVALAAGADTALVTNNGAAGVLLVLAALARGRAVVVSRGEEVEIGGGFRVPEVMEESGAHLVEVGTTNRTRRADYERAVEATDPALLLKVHRSNYRVTGFTEEAAVPELVGLGPPIVVDLGSGLLDASTPWLAAGPPAWLRDEPAVRQTLLAGADVVVFSGDKLLGGPQAGVIAGRADLVQRCARHPLARALRPGSLVLGALQEVALAYLRRDAGETVPFWKMATLSEASLRQRAEALGVGEVTPCWSVADGGTLPGVQIPSVGIALPGDRTGGLRRHEPPVIARVEHGRTIVDLRTVRPDEDPTVAAAARGALTASS
jgi:L-seryl-tRNA(Ser) seleniumtransferase